MTMWMLAEVVSSPWTPSNVLIALGGIVVGGGGAATVLGIFAKGYWTKNIKPLILEAIAEHANAPTVRETREKEILDLVSAYLAAEHTKKTRHEEISGVFSMHHNAEQAKKARQDEVKAYLRTPEVMDERDSAIKKVIDNEIARVDGLIHLSVKKEVDLSETRLGTKLDGLMELLREDTSFRQEVLMRMSRLEGGLQVLIPQRRPVDAEDAKP